jgi:hypothetical protein
MAGRMLVLDVGERGIDARTGREHFFAPWDGLPDPADRESRFQAALDLISGEINLSACDEAILLISSRQVFFRNITLPFKHDKKIQQVLPLELAPCLPFPDQPFVFDFLRRDLHVIPDQHLFLTAVIPEQIVKQMVSCLMSMKIRPRIIIPKGYALAVLFLETRKQNTDLAFLYTGESETTLVLTAKGRPVMVRSLPGKGLDTGKVVTAVFQTVTGFRQKTGLETDFDICIAFENQTRQPAETIQTALSRHPFFKTARLTMHGIDTGTADFFLLTRSRDLINLCQGIYGTGSFFQKFRSELVILAATAVIALGLSVYSLKKEITLLETAVTAEKNKVAAVYQDTFPDSAGITNHDPLLLMQAQIRDALKKSDSRILPGELTEFTRIRAVDVLKELSVSIPDTMDVQLSRLLLRRGQLTIAGVTDSFHTVDRLKTALERSPVFKTVIINTAEAGKAGNQVAFNFNIVI